MANVKYRGGAGRGRNTILEDGDTVLVKTKGGGRGRNQYDTKTAVKRSMRFNNMLNTTIEATPVSKALNPKRYAESTGQTYKRPNFRDWLAKHRKS